MTMTRANCPHCKQELAFADLKDAAELAGVQPGTVYALRYHRAFPREWFILGNRPVWSGEQIEEWLRERKQRKLQRALNQVQTALDAYPEAGEEIERLLAAREGASVRGGS